MLVGGYDTLPEPEDVHHQQRVGCGPDQYLAGTERSVTLQASCATCGRWLRWCAPRWLELAAQGMIIGCLHHYS
jgi:hypothetical protein